MKVFNTLTKKKEEFVPLEEGKVRMYVCGPTVYNYIHIGNARPMIVFDTVRRYFEYKGYDVNYVSNFTDVDDKIIKKAIEEQVSAQEISQRYIAECKKDMAGMNVKPATKHPLATEEICGMVEMISELIDKGYAYEKNGTVYFSTRKFKDYGKLSHKNLDDLRSGGRSLLVSGEDEKEDPLDFVLWKPKKEGEPFWKSPWCDGRPGWHIECSVMSKKYLGEEIDIEFLPAVKDAVNMSFSERNKLGFKMAMKKDLGFFFGLGSVAYAVSLSLSSLTGGRGIQLSSLLTCRPHMIFRLIQAKCRCKKENRQLLPKDLFHLKGFMVAGTDNQCYKDDLEELWGIRPMELFAGTEPSIMGTETWTRKGMYFFPDTAFYEFITERIC